jgi:hypothetical protein
VEAGLMDHLDAAERMRFENRKIENQYIEELEAKVRELEASRDTPPSPLDDARARPSLYFWAAVVASVGLVSAFTCVSGLLALSVWCWRYILGG